MLFTTVTSKDAHYFCIIQEPGIEPARLVSCKLMQARFADHIFVLMLTLEIRRAQQQYCDTQVAKDTLRILEQHVEVRRSL